MTQPAWGATPGKTVPRPQLRNLLLNVACSLQVFRAQDAPREPGQQMQNKVSGANKVLF